MHSPRNAPRRSQEFARAQSGASSLSALPENSEVTAPLLPQPGADAEAAGRAQWVVEDSEPEDEDLSWFGEVKRLLHFTAPLSIESTLWFVCSSMISLAFVGHLGSQPLAACVLANSVYNISGYSLVVGMAAGMNSLSGQAFGAGNLSAMSLILQRALILSCSLSAVVWAAWTQLPVLLPLLGQDAGIAAEASRFLQISAPSLLLNAVSTCIRNHLLAQLDVVVASLMSAALTVVTPVVNYLLIYGLALGLDGAALANNVEAGLYCGMLAIYFVVKERGLVKSWGAFRGWGQYLAIALPALSMKCTEWWLFEALVLLAGILPNPDQSVSVTGIAYNLTSFTYLLFPLGLCDALSTMVATKLGGGRWRGARHSTRVALCLSAGVMVVSSTVIAAGSGLWPRLFTHDAQVVALCAAILPIVAVSSFTDGLNATLAGVVTGAGRQATGAVINFCTYWGVGLALAATLAFRARMGVRGLWVGVLAGSVTQAVVMLTYVGLLNWEREAARVRGKFAPTGAAAGAAGVAAANGPDDGGSAGAANGARATGDVEDGKLLAGSVRAREAEGLLAADASGPAGEGREGGRASNAGAREAGRPVRSAFAGRHAAPSALPDQPLALGAGPASIAPVHDAVRTLL